MRQTSSAMRGGDHMTRYEAMARLAEQGPVIYAVRLRDGVVKIGYTTDLFNRLHTLQTKEVLGFIFGTRAMERDTHRNLKAHRARGREYYHPTPEVLAVVNEWRAQLGRDPLAA